MLLTITTTHRPATDLGYLLHKNPDRPQSFPLSFGQAHIFYPEASAERCTAVLLLDVDPVALVRGRRGSGALDQYVNDRPYVASSFLSVAIAEVFGSALAGRSKERPALAEAALPLHTTIAALPCRGGDGLLRRLFEPLGYTVTAHGYPRDEYFPEWGASPYFTVTLEATCRLSDLLTHLYVLIPVLDDDKHYWVGDDEVDKLLQRGEGWLAAHPERELITGRYLKHRRLVRAALARLVEDDTPDPDAAAVSHAQEEAAVEERISLHQQRLGSVVAALRASGAKRVLDLGCGEGQLLRKLLEDRSFEAIVGMDVSYRALELAQERLRLERMSPAQRARLTLIQGALTYRDRRLEGYDAAAVVEVIEHLDPPRLAAFERVLFEFARPATVVVTTPNVEYNVKFETLPADAFRHKDHRFEWTRDEFQAWAHGVARRFGYTARFLPIGPEDAIVGAPSQMGIFSREATA
jgi:3' terminal RNA ribose 2'-O-methyltransferase Hen1